ncbi:MAG TPA: hypothetical protein VGQ36_02325 [Thermoanaerobaculia bacterium]|jgi:hypothetical protein|nr:hypothetical protein [Thermoanaerobaculia bacterium]
MSTNENGVSTTVSTDPPAIPAGNHAESAQERILELQRWREQIPRFAIPAAPDATRRLNSVASVSPVFVELTNVALANQPVLVRSEGATPAQVRDLVSYADAYSPLADELEALAHFVRYSVTVARNVAGNEALTTYSLAQRLAKLPQNAHLKPHVADMRRALGRGRKLTPEEAAKKAADRAAKAAAKIAKKVAKLLPPAPISTNQQPK